MDSNELGLVLSIVINCLLTAILIGVCYNEGSIKENSVYIVESSTKSYIRHCKYQIDFPSSIIEINTNKYFQPGDSVKFELVKVNKK